MEDGPLYVGIPEARGHMLGRHQLKPQTIVDAINHFHGRKVERITAFTEFFGPSSFAGTHVLEEPKELKLSRAKAGRWKMYHILTLISSIEH